jgi:hypothetical protein
LKKKKKKSKEMEDEKMMANLESSRVNYEEKTLK